MSGNEWDDYAEGWDSDSSVDAYAEQAFNGLKALGDLSGLKVFDFGCGTGSLTKRMSPLADQIVALDASSEMVRFLDQKQLANVESHAAFLTKELLQQHPEWLGSFDRVTASSVCSFLPDYDDTLALLKKLLKPGGLLVQWDWLAEDDATPMGFTLSRVEQALTDQGFKECQVSKAFDFESPKGTLPVLMAVAKA
ncbi:methyltransferase [Oceanospirillum sanctuarii]|uniref:methyltransferase n=1 Tax=Oceanospirillum sanctuarii TaxID=1434821 RepID=UPI000A3C0079|nr:methyltransferase [Oceanospirillum sanctuarii]